MAGMKKNIWLLYWVLVVVTMGLFILFGHNFYHSNLQKYQDKQLLQLELFAASVDSLFKSQESLLEVVGHQLVEQNDFTRTAAMQIRPLLDNLMRIHPIIAGFGLANPNGDFIAVSSNVDLARAENLIANPATKVGFTEALNSNRMVLGHTYYFDAIDSLVIPIRKSIRNQHGEVEAVMTAGLKVESTLVFRNNIHANPYNIVSLIREDLYRTFVSADASLVNRYDAPIDDHRYKEVIAAAASQLSLSEPELKASQKAVTVTTNGPQVSYLMTVKYLSDYKVWAVSATEMHFIRQQFYSQLGFYLLIFTILQLAFYGLVRSIANNEQQTIERLNKQATHDTLTGLPNRLYLRNNVNSWLKNKTSPFSLLFIDMDNFKSVNDTHGHDFGDQVLKQITQRLGSFNNDQRLLVREASDEFILLVKESDPALLKSLATTMIAKMAEPYVINDVQFLLSCSVGIAVYPTHGNDLDALLRAADISMYRAKQERNSFNIFTTEMQEQHLYKTKVEQRLRFAIEQQKLFMVYQPQVDMDGKLHGVEALVRWQDEELGFVPPDLFIPVAESSGLMVKLGKFIIERSVSDIATYVLPQRQDLNLSINISVKQFIQQDFAEHLLTTIDTARLDRKRITLEITENLFIEDLEQFKPICNEMNQQGLKISLDDFGTGYSSLSMLKDLPIDELKIDKSFVDNIENDAKSFNMVKNIIAIGKNFGMAVLAEGVETELQANKLAECGCDLLQGYYYAKPLNVEQLQSYLDDQTEK
ncbi:EAL domain-containing protein [Vibrio vulnificus]|uniref:bifunctional diguanylate cyclase/phosphodiesterase n=1 Tax=Vibrio vulnificus TaxID=672 RepID=UPI001A29CCBA|nr:EAL domain-containing protein [Vibrio vulnificus]MDS1771264.1 EAL domain-containing protein [Vibrio vulnificus]MDS1851028.1 EAL domain-containing protein [Vibrio vulnificus]HAS6318954.1 EAL domain-containing protein [Vibrio vulnificus]HDY7590520.1 EAL domain-containing protein [Vibrio vulnificus]HDY8176413.1 EAL domain-containing protein [Vibrio vulnificus]